MRVTSGIYGGDNARIQYFGGEIHARDHLKGEKQMDVSDLILFLFNDVSLTA
jgi:hypothetical protein